MRSLSCCRTLLVLAWVLSGLLAPPTLAQGPGQVAQRNRPGAPVAAPAAQATAMQEAREVLLEEIRRWMSEQTGQPPQAVSFPPLDARLKVSDCPAGPVLDFPFGGRDLVRARCEAPVWQVFVRVELRSPRPVVIAARPLAAGTLIEEADLGTRLEYGARPEAIEDPGRARGRLLRRALTVGEPLDLRHLEERIAVYRTTRALEPGSLIDPASVEREWIGRDSMPPGVLSGPSIEPGLQLLQAVPAGHRLSAADVSPTRLVAVARQALLAGQPIEAAWVELRRMSKLAPGQSWLTDLKLIEQSEPVHHIQAGDVLSSTDLRPALMVRRGEVITLTLGTAGGIEVSVKAEAVQDGRLGERIQLRNPESGRTFGGLVTGRNAARGL
jgi:flagella basal body P-ring formation protein FlgA